MEIKIFLPNNFHEFHFLYGIKRIEEAKSEETLVYYIVKCTKKQENTGDLDNLEYLGSCGIDNQNKGDFNITTNGNKISKIKVNNLHKDVMILYYNPSSFQNFNANEYQSSSIENHFFLFLANALQTQKRSNSSVSSVLLLNILNTFSLIMSTILIPVAPFFQKTAIFQHSKSWKKGLNERRMRNGSIILDVLLGIMLCLLMNHIRNPENYFMSLTEFVLNKLRMLLEELDGSPVGLKLNVQLNNFLHRCFIYHVDLWWNFIIIVEPAIRYLFVPITIFGLMGLSFQCAMLCDIITLITLHAHCFYIYAAMLYKLELTSLRSLWRIVLGRRLNVLKNRVESQQYTNRQLFLATLFFTTLLFLLPTIITYYVVFASLRLLIYCLTFILMHLQRKILTFPFYAYIRWIFGLHIDISNISFDLISHENINGKFHLHQIELGHFKSKPWKTSPFTLKIEDDFSKPLPIDSFAKNLLRGELMAFLPNVNDK